MKEMSVAISSFTLPLLISGKSHSLQTLVSEAIFLINKGMATPVCLLMFLSLHLQQLRPAVLVWQLPGLSPNS